MSRIYPTLNGNIQLTDTEAKIIDTLPNNGWEPMCIIRNLKNYGNADKVFRVLELEGTSRSKHASYTIYPIITQIGERTPEEYVADVKRASDEYYALWKRYAAGELSIDEYDRMVRDQMS